MTPPRDLATEPGAHVYPMSTGWKVFMILFGVSVAVGSLVLVWFVHRDPMPPTAVIVFDLLLALFAGFGVYCAATAIRSRVVLTHTVIQQRGVIVEKSMRIDAIASWRSIPAGNGLSYIEFLPEDPTAKPLRIARPTTADRVFDEWLASLPSQDAQDEQVAEQALLADPRYGSDPAERLREYARLHSRVRWLVGAGVAVAIWGLIFPYPYRLVVSLVALTPLLGLAIARGSRGRIRVDQKPNSRDPSVVYMVLVPSIVLGFRTYLDVSLLDWTGPAIAAIVGGALFSLATLAADAEERRWPAFLLMTLFGSAWAYGATTQLNVALDRSALQTYETRVTGKHVTTGKGGANWLKVAPWGPEKWSGEESVGTDLYDETNVGDLVCISVSEGAFGWRWYWVDRCPD